MTRLQKDKVFLIITTSEMRVIILFIYMSNVYYMYVCVCFFT